MSIVDEINNKTKHGSNMKLYTGIALAVMLIGGYFLYASFSKGDVVTEIQESTYTVKKGDIRIALASDGDIVGDDIIDLNFQVSDVIDRIYKKPGDLVYKGDLIANLDSLLLQINVDKAKIALEVAKLEGNIDIDNAAIALESAKFNLELLESEGSSQGGSDYALIEIQEQQLLTSKQSDAISEIGQMLPEIESTLYEIDLLLGLSTANRHKNDEFELYLSARNTILKSTAKEEWLVITEKLQNFKDGWESYKMGGNGDDDIDLEEYLTMSIALVKSTNQLTQITLDALKASVISASFSETTMSNYISQFENIIVALKKSISDLLEVQQNIYVAQESYNVKLGTLSNDVNTKLLLAQNEYKKAEILYNSVIKRSNDLPIQLAEKNLLEAQKRLSYSRLLAPADGVVLALNGHEGEIAGSNNADSFVQLAIDDDMYIESYVEELDVSKIFPGQNISIVVDAIDGLYFTGVVFFVANAGEKDSNGIIEYKVLISYGTQDDRIKNGMGVTIDYITKQVLDVLVVPVKAVKPYNNKPHVKLENFEYVPVVAGFTDGKMVEILTGLNKGDIILVEQ